MPAYLSFIDWRLGLKENIYIYIYNFRSSHTSKCACQLITM